MKSPLERHRRERGDQRAFVHRRRSWSFEELANQAQRWARALRAEGVKAGDVVAIQAKNSERWVFAAHGLIWLGATLASLHTGLMPEEREAMLRRVKPTLVLGEEELVALGEMAGALKGEELEAAQWRPEDILTILFTSGSTGTPRAVPLSFEAHIASAVASGRRLGREEGDHWLSVLPLFHVGGFSILFRSAVYGTSFELLERFEPREVLETLGRGEATLASFVPTMLHRLLDAAPEGPVENRLRAALIGGGPIRGEELAEARTRGIKAIPTYGMSEASSQAATLGPEEGLQKIESAGRALEGLELKIVDDQGRRLEAGESGRIALKGPMVINAYFDEAAPIDEEGFFLSGDVGHLDEEGYLFVEHRRGERIVSGGENIDPLEVEGALRKQPMVADAVVVGLPDPEWGEALTALVVWRDECVCEKAALEEIKSSCRELLSAYKVPKLIFAVDEIPRRATGKTDRRKAREEASLLRQRKYNHA